MTNVELLKDEAKRIIRDMTSLAVKEAKKRTENAEEQRDLVVTEVRRLAPQLGEDIMNKALSVMDMAELMTEVVLTELYHAMSEGVEEGLAEVA